MPRKAGGPSPAEWERNKREIVSLASQYKWTVVRDIMESRYGFVASPDQYTAHMKAWGANKNLKENEWRGAIHQYDRLVSRHHGKEIRMLILGKIVRETKIKRSRAKYCRSNSGIAAIVPPGVTFEILGEDGTWNQFSGEGNINIHLRSSPYTSPSPEDMNLFSGLPDNLIAPETPYNNAASHSETEEYLGMTANAPIEGILGAAAPISFQNFAQETHIPPDFGAIAPAYQDPSFGAIMNSWVIPSISENHSFQALDLGLSSITSLPNYAECLQQLPFKYMEMFLREKDVLGGLFIYIRSPPVTPYGDMAMTRPRSRVDRRIEAARFPAPFLPEALGIRSSSPPNAMSVDNHPIHARAKLQSLQAWLPGEASGEQHGQNGDLISNDEILETKLIRILLFSMLNGFTGLGDISISDVVQVLGRLENISTLFFQVLKANPTYVAKSLSESLFKLAIDARDSHTIRQILSRKLVQVNTVVCNAHEQRVTAVQRAVQLLDVKTLNCLIEFSADVNADLNPLSRLKFGLIDMLLWTRGPRERFSTLFIEITQILLNAGFELKNEDISTILCRHDGPEWMFSHLSEILRMRSRHLSCDHILVSIATHMGDKSGSQLINLIVTHCEKLHKGSCLRRSMEGALVGSAQRGHLKSIRALLPYCENPYPAVVASFSSGQKDIIELMLTKISAFDNEVYQWEGRVTTPLSEAIRIQSDKLIRICEDKGALEQLRFSHCFEAAIVAAVSTGNERYVRKLLQHIPPLCDRDTFDKALSCSIRNSHDSVSFVLLEEGTAIIESDWKGYLSQSLHAAVSKHDSGMVREILDRGVFNDYILQNPDLTYRSSILDQAIIWGDQSIISDLNLVLPGMMMFDASYLVQHLESGNESFLQFLIDSHIAGTDKLDELLQKSIHTISPEKAIRLVELGACPWNGDTLAEAAKHRLDILRALLEYIPKIQKWVPIGSGRLAATFSINAGIPGLNALDTLISAGLVVDYDIVGGELPTLLGLAIDLATEYQGTYPIIERLLKTGCDLNKFVVDFDKSSQDNVTAMLAAVKTQKLGLVKLLHHHGAEVNTQAKRGLRRTPLQLASQLGNLGIVKFLLQEGADVNAAPAFWGGGTAIQLAAISGNCNVLVELLNHGANVYTPPARLHGRWPIEGAGEHGRLDMIALLFKVMKPEPEHCKRAMELAGENGHMGCKEFIQECLDKPGENLWSLETPWASNLGGEYINNTGPDLWNLSMAWQSDLGN